MAYLSLYDGSTTQMNDDGFFLRKRYKEITSTSDKTGPRFPDALSNKSKELEEKNQKLKKEVKKLKFENQRFADAANPKKMAAYDKKLNELRSRENLEKSVKLLQKKTERQKIKIQGLEQDLHEAQTTTYSQKSQGRKTYAYDWEKKKEPSSKQKTLRQFKGEKTDMEIIGPDVQRYESFGSLYQFELDMAAMVGDSKYMPNQWANEYFQTLVYFERLMPSLSEKKWTSENKDRYETQMNLIIQLQKSFEHQNMMETYNYLIEEEKEDDETEEMDFREFESVPTPKKGKVEVKKEKEEEEKVKKEKAEEKKGKPIKSGKIYGRRKTKNEISTLIGRVKSTLAGNLSSSDRNLLDAFLGQLNTVLPLIPEDGETNWPSNDKIRTKHNKIFSELEDESSLTGFKKMETLLEDYHANSRITV